MKYAPKLDPQKDLKGATPKTLAKALLSPRHRGKPVIVRSQSSTDKGSTNKSGDSIPQLRKGV